MNIDTIQKEFQDKVGRKIRLLPEGHGRYQVFTPFLFDDGDHFLVTLRKENGGWILSDEGHTYIHLTYDIDEGDLHRGNRAKIIGDALAAFGITEADGELQCKIHHGEFGNALFSFVQALLQITDVTYLSRERVRSTFMEDFKHFMQDSTPPGRLEFDYADKQHDAKRQYVVDCRLNGQTTPLFVFGVNGDDKCRDTTIILLQFEKWGIRFNSLAIFEDQEVIQRKVLARFSDVCQKQYSSLTGNADRIKKYVGELIGENK